MGAIPQISPKSKQATRRNMPGDLLFLWCRQQESNPQPTDYKSVALPLRHAGKALPIMPQAANAPDKNP